MMSRRRAGVSELVATVLLIGATLIAGFAVWGWVNGEAGVSERAYGASVGGNVNYLEEKFVVVNLNFSSSAVTVWLYNDGQVDFQPVQVLLYNASRSMYLMYNATEVVSFGPGKCSSPNVSGYEGPDVLYDPLSSAPQPSAIDLPQGGVQQLTLTLPSCSSASFKSGVAYSVSILGLYGNTVTAFLTK